MAVANTKSTIVTNLDATPMVLNNLNIAGAVLREQVATVEVLAADDNGSVYRMCRVHSSWRISELTLFGDAIASASSFDLGLYQTAANGGAVVDANAYADAASIASASLTGTQLLFEGGSAVGVEKIEQAVWQNAGLTADPGRFYDLALTANVVGTATGTVSVRVRYVANS